ncbi:hypothetical protein CkaCkLH20_08548 [Colletotrichum karsti]|uniref:Oxidoreductase AflY n=1 Tax=Colletotrichum karsti TaxID=1095194 RepID=A0A9P6I027_9PEZI|nr:uncharacterized protein CkaCkLH20_08548 [Colletotrichum karsti]KAF9873814.1 hypothetical protein CkaCkLH20_08548 [Colletotrichum karsti]
MSYTHTSSSRIVISPKNTGLWAIDQDEDAARRTEEVLKKDLNVLHHVLALYGTGANAKQIERAFDLRHDLQRPVEPRHDEIIRDMLRDESAASKYLGDEKYYPDFLAYFQHKIDAGGYEQVVRDTLLRRDAASDDMLLRLHAGVLHPLIQLMYGLEWKQPAIVAEALAQASVHEVESLDELLLPSERDAEGSPQGSRMPAVIDLYEEIRTSSAFEGAARFRDESKIRDGILQRAKAPMLALLRRVRVQDDELEERTAEMFHAAILVASSAAVHPPHHVKFDFFLMHHINAAVMYLTTLTQSWLSREDKRRLLEWKIRMDLIEYTARGRTAIDLGRITSYSPKVTGESSIKKIGNRLHDFGDDGHGIKQARATALCHELMKRYEDKPWAVLKGDEVWRKIQHMVVDALQAPGPLYARSAGFEEAWEDVPPQSTPRRPDEELRALQTGSGSSAVALASA